MESGFQPIRNDSFCDSREKRRRSRNVLGRTTRTSTRARKSETTRTNRTNDHTKHHHVTWCLYAADLHETCWLSNVFRANLLSLPMHFLCFSCCFFLQCSKPAVTTPPTTTVIEQTPPPTDKLLRTDICASHCFHHSLRAAFEQIRPTVNCSPRVKYFSGCLLFSRELHFSQSAATTDAKTSHFNTSVRTNTVPCQLDHTANARPQQS